MKVIGTQVHCTEVAVRILISLSSSTEHAFYSYLYETPRSRFLLFDKTWDLYGPM